MRFAKITPSNGLFARLSTDCAAALVRAALVVRRARGSLGLAAAALAIGIVCVGKAVAIVVLAVGATGFRSFARRAAIASLAGLVASAAAFQRATLYIATA